MPVRVVDARDRRKVYAVYVGRPWAGLPGHPLANPFKGPGAVERYARWLDAHPDRRALLRDVWIDTDAGALPLMCWCGPWDGVTEPAPYCHAVALARALMAEFEVG